MQVTKGTWRMHEQCEPGSVSSSPTQEPGNEAITDSAIMLSILKHSVLRNRKGLACKTTPRCQSSYSYHYRDLIRGCGTQLLYRQQDWLLNIYILYFRLGRLWWVSESTEELLSDNARIFFHWSNTAMHINFVCIVTQSLHTMVALRSSTDQLVTYP